VTDPVRPYQYQPLKVKNGIVSVQPKLTFQGQVPGMPGPGDIAVFPDRKRWIVASAYEKTEA
jgi:hypothetical protein